MEKKYILVVDEGTTGTRAMLFDREMKIVGQAYKLIQSHFPSEGSFEQDAEEIFNSSVEMCREVVRTTGIDVGEIACAGVTNQRTSWVFWDKDTGKPLRNMVSWLDTRGSYQIPKWDASKEFNAIFPGLAPHLPPLYMPLILDLLKDREPEFKARFEQGNILYGTVDAWLVYKFTGGKVHATVPSNASNSTIYDSPSMSWVTPMLDFVGMKPEMMPEVREESVDFGCFTADILGVELPILSVVADQQSALFSQGCHAEGTAKCTNGTGTFIDLNLGKTHRVVPGLTTTVAWKLDGTVNYMAEGMSNTTGACIEWVKNNLKLFDSYDNLENEITSVPDNGGVYFVPALNGMGIPFSDSSARAAFLGASGAAKREHFVRAAVEAVAYSGSAMFLAAQEQGVQLSEIMISGGVSKSATMAQIMANVTGARIVRPKSVEATALGAAELAAMALGWMTMKDVPKYMEEDRAFTPNEDAARDKEHYKVWRKAVERCLKW